MILQVRDIIIHPAGISVGLVKLPLIDANRIYDFLWKSEVSPQEGDLIEERREESISGGYLLSSLSHYLHQRTGQKLKIVHRNFDPSTIEDITP